MGRCGTPINRDRRRFLKQTTALGGATAAFGLGGQVALDAQQAGPRRPARWHHTADVVIVGAGASGLSAAIAARDQGASVIVVEANHDIGGHAMLSGGRIPLGGGTPQQQKYGIQDSADQVYLDHTNLEFRFSGRDLVRMWADENAPTMAFLLENGVTFADVRPSVLNGGV